MRLRNNMMLLLILMLQVASSSAAQVRLYKWEVEYMYASPDCENSVVMGINGQFPGPTIRAQVGDTIQVLLTNKLSTEGVVIHWRGILQKGTPWADGTASISQCAINPGETFNYTFQLDKPGTYFYHGHYGMHRSAGLYGSLIVELEDGKIEPFHYDEEFNLLLSDWWHQSSHQQELALSSKPFRWIGEPQSLLINGRGQFNCTMEDRGHIKSTLPIGRRKKKSAIPKCDFKGDHKKCAPQILHVLPNKTYRLRIASSTALASLNLAIQDHKMVVVEADGNYVTPFTVEDIDIYSGESYSVLLTTDQDPSQNYWIAIGVRGRKPPFTPQALTILNYLPTSVSKPPPSPPPITPLWNDYQRSQSFAQQLFALMGSPSPPPTFHRRLILLNTQNLINGFTKWAINNVSLSLPTTPYLGSIKYKLENAFDPNTPPETFPAEYDIMKPPVNPNSVTGNGVYTFELNQVVDVILQNANVLNGTWSEIHPWHLHGHDFWVLGYGKGKFDPKRDEGKLNLKNPPLKNTAVIFPYGWTALRFVTDNPGVWAFHCHIEPHLRMGMGVIFAEGVDQVKDIPAEAITCGLTGKMLAATKTTVH